MASRQEIFYQSPDSQNLQDWYLKKKLEGKAIGETSKNIKRGEEGNDFEVGSKFINKYRLVGVIDLALGILYIVPPLGSILFIIPKINQLSREFGLPAPNPIVVYLLICVSILIGFVGIVLSLQLFSVSVLEKKYFKYGLVFAIVTWFVGGLFGALTALATLEPVYKLLSSP